MNHNNDSDQTEADTQDSHEATDELAKIDGVGSVLAGRLVEAFAGDSDDSEEILRNVSKRPRAHTASSLMSRVLARTARGISTTG
jgi:hypothetical protein